LIGLERIGASISLPLSIDQKNLVGNKHKLIYAMTMTRMKDMKTSILHAFHVLHGLKIKLAHRAGAAVFGCAKEIRQLHPAQLRRSLE